MNWEFVAFLGAIAIGYVYALVSGFTDASTAIATAVGTRAFSPTQAVIVAAFFELLGALTGTAVALTIGIGILRAELLDQGAVVAAVGGALSWSLLAYVRGLPVSETHGVIGGLLGAGLAAGGLDAIIWSGVAPVLLGILLAPLLGLAGGILLLIGVYRLFTRVPRRRAETLARRGQRLSAAYVAFSHGRNDAQKPMGLLMLALVTYTGVTVSNVPLWIVLSVAVASSMGVAAGGWRIIRTLGLRITGLSPEQGFAAEVAGGTVLELASQAGVPVSTTQTITSAIVGVGVVKGLRQVRWPIAIEIATSWLLTLPVTMALGFAIAMVLRFLPDL
jgi:inorganic phosphate transporter, PiT family